MKKLYIKFEEGNQESLDRACREAERLGYTKAKMVRALYFQGNGILICCDIREYYTSRCNEEDLIRFGYKENFITNNNIMKYKEGDILVDKDGDVVKILGVCGQVYFLSQFNNFIGVGENYTIQELDQGGYYLKTEPETGIREVTMQEIEEAFGEPVVIRK